MRENRSHGSEGGEAQTFPTPIDFLAVHKATLEDVGGRDKPGQGDLELCPARYTQPVSLNRTAVDLIRPSTPWGGPDKDVDTRIKSAQDD